ncbi:MAG: hypothetical protein KIY12_00580 [Thermoplasmata archaeon]|uniref:Uncharacterized protein n=1 Tax=Candidatus Sysuiplasma superficiale TaxID=2823368 RepID=A0A8J7YM23_9ARCH|nr:hypothetical protein [Candidatus Sysuiplasma superficiale]MBX8643220.1 hypothetical protein [Candidatus Sysuiplasma superficiale]MCL4346634.1 hypothetical protein [Candidatus Thermoplasmatota archaeon]MCL5437534.1 hypothetical protein [Candidatus Thermoplasmatota archaeon]
MSKKSENVLYLLLGVILPALLLVIFVYYRVNIFFIIVLLTYALTVVLTFYGTETKTQ